MTVHNSVAEPWRVTLVDTGDATGTGGRLRRVAKYLERDETFCMTYGDGVADVDITASIAFHKAHGKQRHPHAASSPSPASARLGLKDTQVYSFQEKPTGRRWLDQRRLLRSLTQSRRTTSPTTAQMFEREPIEASRRRRRGSGLLPPRLLAGDGHAARQAATRRAVEPQERLRGKYGRTGQLYADANATPLSWRGAKSSSPATPASKAAGSRSGWRISARTVRGYALDPSTDPNLFTLPSARLRHRRHPRRHPRLRRSLERCHAGTSRPRSSSTSPRSLSSATPMTIPSAPTKPMSSAPRACSKPCAERPRPRRRLSSPPTSATRTRSGSGPTARPIPLGGYDPYSSSARPAPRSSPPPSASRTSPRHPRLAEHHGVAIATARAGNVIGGGDWSSDRLIPDLVRGFLSGEPVGIRHPHAIRPWQHVLEPLHGYIRLAEKLLTDDPRFATAYNFGPSDDDARPVAWIAERMTAFWGNGASWVLDDDPGPHEAGYLKLDSSRAHADLGWTPQLNLQQALELLVGWYRAWQTGSDMHTFTLNQIEQFRSHCEK